VLIGAIIAVLCIIIAFFLFRNHNRKKNFFMMERGYYRVLIELNDGSMESGYVKRLDLREFERDWLTFKKLRIYDLKGNIPHLINTILYKEIDTIKICK